MITEPIILNTKEKTFKNINNNNVMIKTIIIVDIIIFFPRFNLILTIFKK